MLFSSTAAQNASNDLSFIPYVPFLCPLLLSAAPLARSIDDNKKYDPRVNEDSTFTITRPLSGVRALFLLSLF
jgi:hypothetical protein